MMISINFSIRQRIKIGLGNTLYGLSSPLFNFIFSIIVVRVFTRELWGSFTQLFLIVGTLSMLVNWGSKDFLLREFSRENRIADLWKSSLMSRAILVVIAIPLVFLFANVPGNQWLLGLWLAVTFVYRSFDSLIVFERKFRQALLVELGGFLWLVILLFLWKGAVDINTLASLFVGLTLSKAIAYSIVFRRILFSTRTGAHQSNQLLLALPFFLPQLVGFLQSKADTFVVALRLPLDQVGNYYLLINLLSYCHVFAILAIAPFLKNFYRMNPDAAKKVQRVFLPAGLVWSVICIFGIHLVMTAVYRIHLPDSYYLIAWLALPPYFGYFLLMQQLIRNDTPYLIVAVNGGCAVLNFILSLFLIDTLGFMGGLVACASMQWVLLVCFLVLTKKEYE